MGSALVALCSRALGASRRPSTDPPRSTLVLRVTHSLLRRLLVMAAVNLLWLTSRGGPVFTFKSLQSAVFSQGVAWRADRFMMRLVAWAASFLKHPLVSPWLKEVIKEARF